jgi:hypothetical protein
MYFKGVKLHLREKFPDFVIPDPFIHHLKERSIEGLAAGRSKGGSFSPQWET